MLKTLARQTAVYGISTIVAKLLNYLLTPYLTRIMSTAEYGVVTDMYALIPFAMVLLTMGLETGYFRFSAKSKTPRRRQEVFSTTWGAVSYVGLLFFVAVSLWLGPVSRALGYGDHPSYILLAAGIILLDVLAAIPFVRLREQGRARRYVTVRIVSVCITLALSFFLYGALPRIGFLSQFYDPDFGAGYYLAANLLSSFVTLLLVIPARASQLFRGMNWRLLRQIMVYSLPLLISGIAGTANEFIDRQLIKFLIPEGDPMSQLGIYGAVIKIGVVMVLFTQMYRLGAEPFFLANFKKEDFVRANAEAMKYFILVSVAIFVGITLFSNLFALIIGRDFREGMFILPIVLAGNICAGIVLNLSFWYKQSGSTRYAVIVTGAGLAVTLALGVALIPRLGYYGAALARLACEVVMVAVSYHLNQKHFPTPYDLRRIGEYFLLGGAVYAAGILTAGLPAVARYPVNLLLLAAFLRYAVFRERIDVRGMMRSIVKR